MPRIVLGALAAAILLVVPATAQGDSAVRVRGTVVLKSIPKRLVTVRTARQAVALRVPGSLARIRLGQRVELRGSTLRAQGKRSRVLAQNVSIASSQALAATSSPKDDDSDEADDDEVEIKGTLTGLSPLTVQSPTRTVTCTVPAGMSLAGFAVGDFVEVTCDLKGGAWVLRKLEREDDDDEGIEVDDDDGDNSGPGSGDNDDGDDDHADDDDEDDDEDDDDNSGPGGGDDDD